MVSYGLGSPSPSPSPSPVIPGAVPKSPSPSIRGAPSAGSSPTGVRKTPGFTISPSCPHVPRRRGRLGKFQGPVSYPIGREFPGRKIEWSTARPTNGDVWYRWKNANHRIVCRAHINEEEDLDEDAVRDVAKVMSHPNLVNLVDHSGFGRLNVRRETAWEFTDAGTLNSLILAHGDGLPESLIWHTLVSLLQAVRYLNTGRPTDDLRDGAVRGWKPIVHNAIDPANIFYCHPRTEPGYKTPTYGRCKLGNFSRAMVIESTYDDVNLSDLYAKDIEGEITGYEAPDLSSFQGEPRGVWGKTVGSASDVWSIGAVAVAMMTGDTLWPLVMRENIKVGMMSRRGENWRTVYPTERFERLQALTEGSGMSTFWGMLPFTYSDTLKLFVESMLGVDPWARADVQHKLTTAINCRVQTWRALKDAKDEMVDEYVNEGEPDLPYDPDFDSD